MAGLSEWRVGFTQEEIETLERKLHNSEQSLREYSICYSDSAGECCCAASAHAMEKVASPAIVEGPRTSDFTVEVPGGSIEDLEDFFHTAASNVRSLCVRGLGHGCVPASDAGSLA